MKLSKQQLDYALMRMKDKIREKRYKEYPEQDSNSLLNDPEAIYQFLSKSKAPLVDKAKFIRTWNNGYKSEVITKFFVFPDSFDKKHNDYLKKREDIDAKYEKLEQELQDKLYLSGNADEALELINSL
ncbi:hypothetical protein UFOVP135_50 [uncultured Caudovirales phage]|uniref:Uncharacterized protein n=1 Tax=uncultured Caudovirales phage TaxID=2100421 RepID=A0A6J5LG91_9CAUD|nr:hypothetical protein UFOVP135_50 [uncultured Caudovirales phage]